MAPKRQRRVVGTVVKTTRKVVEETLQVSVEGGEGNGDQNDSKESKVVEVEVEVEEKKAQESQTSVTHLEDSQAKEKAEEEKTNKRNKKSKQAPKERAEEPPQRDKKQEKDGRREGKDQEEPPVGEGKQKGGGVVVEGEEKGKKRGRGGKRRRRKRYGGGVEGIGGGYKRYVFRVLKQVHPGMAVSSRAMAVLDGMMIDMFERLADEAARLSQYAGKATLSSREIQDAVRLVLPGELGKHAISEGTKAVSKYMSADHGT
ncbi:uncharacterized protein [Elaeis guineensis]|uniref:Histone H2B.11 n=1 Tax=Elaeis guineensis var. tenera TaxID=51953 RepID=A0A6I9SBP2_ELAGV|nr:histone H2B.11 [Elaeis guineensis]